MRNSMVIAALAGIFAMALAASAADTPPAGDYKPRIDKQGW